MRFTFLLALLLLPLNATAAERWLNPSIGDDANDGTRERPWRTAAKAVAKINAPGNAVTRLVIDTSGSPLWLESTFFLGPNARGIVITSASARRADLRAYKPLQGSQFFQPDPGRYPHVWATTDTQEDVVLWEKEGAAPEGLIWYDHPNRYGAGRGDRFAGAVADFVERTPGSFFTDGRLLYFRPLRGHPVNEGRLYVRSRRFSPDPDQTHAFDVRTAATVERISVGGTALAAAADGDPVAAYVLRVTPGEGETVVRDCLLYYGGKHVFGSIGGAPRHSLLIEDVTVEQGSPYAGVGGQTPLVSFADGELHARHVYRRVRVGKTTGLVGSAQGENSGLHPAFLFHNAGVSNLVWDVMLLEDCDFLGAQIVGFGGAAPGAFVVRRSRIGWGQVYGDALLEGCALDTAFVTPAAGASVTMRDSTLTLTRAGIYGPGFVVGGTLTLEGNVIDARAAPSGTVLLYAEVGSPAARVMARGNTFLFSLTGSAYLLGTIDGSAWSRLEFAGNSYQLGAYSYATADSRAGQPFSSMTFAEWRAAGQDVGSQFVEPGPVFVTDEKGRALALDVVTMLREPFTVERAVPFEADRRTRVMLFVTNVTPVPAAPALVTVEATDAAGRAFALPVEDVRALDLAPHIAAVVVRLDAPAAAGDYLLRVTVGGRAGNGARLRIDR